MNTDNNTVDMLFHVHNNTLCAVSYYRVLEESFYTCYCFSL